MPCGTRSCHSVFTKPRKPSPHPANNCNHALPVRDTHEDGGDYLPNEYSKITNAKLVWAKPGVPKHWDRNQMPPNVPGRVWEWQEEDNYWQLYMEKREGRTDMLVLVDIHHHTAPGEQPEEATNWVKENCLYMFIGQDKVIHGYEWADVGDVSINPDWEEFYETDEDNDMDTEEEYARENNRDTWIRAWQAGDSEAASSLWRYWVVAHSELVINAAALIYMYWHGNKDIRPVDCPLQAKAVMQMDKDLLFKDGKIGSGIRDNGYNVVAALGTPHACYKKMMHCSVCGASHEALALHQCKICDSGMQGCVEMSLAQIEAAGGIPCMKCCKDQGMHAPPYNYHGSLPIWSLGPVHADPVIVIMVHWQESGKHTMSDLSSKIVRAYLGEMLLSEHGTTWSVDDQPSRQADGMQLICAHIADLVNKVKALYNKKFCILTIVDVHSNDGNGELLYNKANKYHTYGTPMQVCASVLGTVVPKEVCNDSTPILLTCSGMVLKALHSVQMCT
ncbi:hypothetical protein DACRYDRAFT_14366 [Dacryopinax primogenitus]|uniref:Uncharacterized protein n=1 Tax=Dacryopinax primogenitus (strain DJM 731) TaxID=1858805 RepID=M5GD32_DACPD|nr:uncharacterized protein DACRYDRAFT_14366 [Dacryopinax primogenitus]EJU04212.1 hypothetical protein DACRYDRAFT_14366 [Dacryopinax primogenitus]